MRYESNPKHSEPWQRGRRGSLCPPELRAVAQTLLEQSEEHEGKRYVCHEGRAFCAQEHRTGVWHGYPVAWAEVPAPLKLRWLREGKIRKRDLRPPRELGQ